AGRNRANDRAGPAAVLFQMKECECENLIRREPCPVFVNNTETVGVAVEAETDLRLAAADELRGVGHVLGIRLGMMSAEERVEFIVKQGDFGAGAFKQCV